MIGRLKEATPLSRVAFYAWVFLMAGAFIGGLFSLTYAAWSLRPLAFDGATFLHGALSSDYYVMDARYTRYIDFIPQAPAVWLAALLGSGHFVAIRTAYMLSYSWIMAVGTLLGIGLCLGYRKPWAALGPLLSFGLVFLPNAAFALSIVPTSLALFWPLLVIQVYGKRRWLEAGAILALSACLAWGHETTLALTALLAALAFFQRYRFAVFANLLSCGCIIIRLRALASGLTGRFWEQATAGLPDSYSMAFVALLLAFVASAVAARFSKSKKWGLIPWLLMVVGVIAAGSCIAFGPGPSDLPDISQTYGWRTTATTFLALIALASWLSDPGIDSFIPKGNSRSAITSWRSMAMAFSLVSVLAGAGLDFRFTKEWNLALRNIEAFAQSRPDASCLQMDREYFNARVAMNGGVCDFCFSQLWATIQPSEKVSQFLWVNPVVQERPPKNLCEHLHDFPNKIGTNFYGPEFGLGANQFDYEFLRR